MTEARSYFSAVFRRRVGVAAVRAIAGDRIRSAAYIGMTRADVYFVQVVAASRVPLSVLLVAAGALTARLARSSVRFRVPTFP